MIEDNNLNELSTFFHITAMNRNSIILDLVLNDWGIACQANGMPLLCINVKSNALSWFSSGNFQPVKGSLVFLNSNETYNKCS